MYEAEKKGGRLEDAGRINKFWKELIRLLSLHCLTTS
jgi:hypothetical protein